MNEILPSTTIDRVCSLRDAALARMEQAVEAMKLGETLATEAAQFAEQAHGAHRFWLKDRSQNDAYARLFKDIDSEKSLRTYRQHLDASVWTHLLHMTGMVHLMDRTAKEQFDQSLAGDVPEVTPDNVQATLEGLLSDAELIFQRGLARTFSDLDRRFKSHDAFKIGARIVLTNVFNAWGSLNYGSRMGDTITDVERVFAVLDGKTEPPGKLIEKIREDRQGGFDPHQSVTETKYFRIRCYKNGNAHLWFLRDDLVEKANRVLAAYYGEVLPDASPGDAEAESDLRSKSGLPSKDLAFYSTPPAVIGTILQDLGLGYKPETYRILEPSAGDGNIAEAIAALGVQVDCIEIHAGRAASIRERVPSASVQTGNFLQMPPTPIYTHVVMNPPFYGTHWIEHVMHAFDFLAPGGTLVAILPATAEVGESSKQRAFREWATKHSRWGRLRFADLPPESFLSSGTRINTCYLTLYKDRY